MIGGQRGLTQCPTGVAAVHHELRQRRPGTLHRRALERAHRVEAELGVAPGVELGDLAHADQQHARGAHVRKAVGEQATAGLAAGVVRGDERADAPTTAFVQRARRLGQAAVFVDRDDHRIGVDLGGMGAQQAEVQAHGFPGMRRSGDTAALPRALALRNRRVAMNGDPI